MNQGLYGMAGGQSGMARTVIFRSPRTLNATNVQTVSLQFMNIAPVSFTPTMGVRTKVFGVTGKGALTFVTVVSNVSSTASNLTVELVLDGILVSNNTISVSNAGQGLFVVGAGMAAGAEIGGVMEWVPFSSSAEVFVTESVAIATNLFASYELHQ